jgi:hypothetical protein
VFPDNKSTAPDGNAVFVLSTASGVAAVRCGDIATPAAKNTVPPAPDGFIYFEPVSYGISESAGSTEILVKRAPGSNGIASVRFNITNISDKPMAWDNVDLKVLWSNEVPVFSGDETINI